MWVLSKKKKLFNDSWQHKAAFYRKVSHVFFLLIQESGCRGCHKEIGDKEIKIVL